MWRAIEGFKGYYLINECGQVKSRDRFVLTSKGHYTFKKGQYLKARSNNYGYKQVRLSFNGISSSLFVHRLLAETFIGKVPGKEYINHKNGIVGDNRLENLEWVTHSENMQHAYDNGLIKPFSIQVVDICTGQLYDSIKEAALLNQIKYSTLKNYLHGKRYNPTCLRIVD